MGVWLALGEKQTIGERDGGHFSVKSRNKRAVITDRKRKKRN
jgi:hypothetical protein